VLSEKPSRADSMIFSSSSIIGDSELGNLDNKSLFMNNDFESMKIDYFFFYKYSEKTNKKNKENENNEGRKQFNKDEKNLQKNLKILL
jgi:hypothetical protein